MDTDNLLRSFEARLTAGDPDDLSLADQLELVRLAQGLRRQLEDERAVHHRRANASQNQMLEAELAVRPRLHLVEAGDLLAVSATDPDALAAWVAARSVD